MNRPAGNLNSRGPASLPKIHLSDGNKGMATCKHVCAVLHAVPLRNCRVDLVIRRAMITPDLMDQGITAYITACGPTASNAKDALEDALNAIAHAICPDSTVQ